MSDEAPPDDGLHQARSTRRRVKVIALAVVGVVVMSAIVLVWQPWRSASCVDDGGHVVDEETGLCYMIPEGWEQEEVSAGSAIASADGSGLVMSTSIDDRSGNGDLDLAARMQAALFSGNGPEHESIRVASGTLDGHASATSIYSDSGIWLMATVLELDGRLVALTSVCSVDESEAIAQIEAVHESLGVL
ncbi:hypothetical protein [Glycomyces tritici]|uniref:Uncharacterized protein n=1 Tax=Glycomyces tritici TaxID=2665176 RepID=A0ABT7YHL5_9ACTN|nr:hypothetical protein [Glycomyces tritici]MDN3238095.1 hypothetical protein [Glycomyces tritici]